MSIDEDDEIHTICTTFIGVFMMGVTSKYGDQYYTEISVYGHTWSIDLYSLPHEYMVPGGLKYTLYCSMG